MNPVANPVNWHHPRSRQSIQNGRSQPPESPNRNRRPHVARKIDRLAQDQSAFQKSSSLSATSAIRSLTSSPLTTSASKSPPLTRKHLSGSHMRSPPPRHQIDSDFVVLCPDNLYTDETDLIRAREIFDSREACVYSALHRHPKHATRPQIVFHLGSSQSRSKRLRLSQSQRQLLRARNQLHRLRLLQAAKPSIFSLRFPS